MDHRRRKAEATADWRGLWVSLLCWAEHVTRGHDGPTDGRIGHDAVGGGAKIIRLAIDNA